MSERVSMFRQRDGFIYLGGLSIGEAVVPPTDLITLLQVLAQAIATDGTDEDRDIARKVFKSWMPTISARDIEIQQREADARRVVHYTKQPEANGTCELGSKERK